ncbi:MAG TPA: NAD(P)-dependent oxidoreductase [Stellaceae bacterium]|nr:NAD(P)-dependent oxidoreductase [Stellaceae bacterium]
MSRSRPRARVIAVGRQRSLYLFEPIVETLRGLGHEVVFHRDSAAFDAAGGALTGADILLAASSFPCTRALMAPAGRLRGIVSPTTGIEGFDLAAATELAILVANGQTDENVDSMAEATIMLILASLYDLRGAEAAMRESRSRPEQVSVRMLGGKTVGLIGFGKIARAITTRLAGWNVSIKAYTRRPPANFGHVRFVELDDLLRTSDVVCVLATLNSESEGLLDANRLASLKHGAVLINTARGAIVDEAALIELAQRRPDLRLALDTFVTEPLPLDSKLRDLPNAILTPHTVGHTSEAHASLPGACVDNVQRLLAGEVPRYVCNPDAVARWQARWVTR